MPKVNLLSDVDPIAVSIVRKGANHKRFFLRKRDGAVIAEGDAAWTGPDVTERDPLIESPAEREPVHKADWSVVYCVVAEPGARENCGLHGDQDTEDEWASPEEIEKAAHRFMKNGALVNKLHEDLMPYGRLVENAVALADFTVNGETIHKGSWYVAIEPNDEGRAAIEAGEFEGVSMQGTGIRTLVEKAKVPLTNKPGKTNWVERAGGLPTKIRHVAEELKGKGKTDSAAIRMAVGVVRNWAAGHDGHGNKVSAKTQAEAAKAIAEWDAKRAKGKVAKTAPDDDTTIAAVLAAEEDTPVPDDSLLRRIAKKLGLDDVDVDELTAEERAALAKTATFAQIIGRLDLNEELPTAFDALRESIYNAFYPYAPAGAEPDSSEIRASLTTSLDEFKAHMLGLFDGISAGTIKKQDGALAKELATLRPKDLDSPPEEGDDNMGDTERIAALEKSVGDTNTAVTALVEKLTPLVERAEAAKAPTVEDLSTQVGELAKGLTAVTEGLKKLGAGGSKQPDDDDPARTPVNKSAEDADRDLAAEIFG